MALEPTEVFMWAHDDSARPTALKALSVRMPEWAFRYVEEMATAADLSRNAMAVQLIEWGIAHALARLPDEMRNELEGAAKYTQINHQD